MFSGPLSDRIESILEKPIVDELKKMKKKKKTPNNVVAESKEFDELWEATQVKCPIPSRSPDQWIQ